MESTPVVVNPSINNALVRGEAMSLMRTLKHEMQLGKLTQGSKIKRLHDGSSIVCTSCYGIDEITILEKPAVAPTVESTRKLQILTGFGGTINADSSMDLGETHFFGVHNVIRDYYFETNKEIWEEQWLASPSDIFNYWRLLGDSGNSIECTVVEGSASATKTTSHPAIATIPEYAKSINNGEFDTYFVITPLAEGAYTLEISQAGTDTVEGSGVTAYKRGVLRLSGFIRGTGYYSDFNVLDAIQFGETLDYLEENSIPGTWDIDPTRGSLLYVLPSDIQHSVTAIFTPTNSTFPPYVYERLITVTPSTPVITWVNPSLTYGQPWSVAFDTAVAVNPHNAAINALDYGLLIFTKNSVEIDDQDKPKVGMGGEFIDVEFYPLPGTPHNVKQYLPAYLPNNAVEIHKAVLTVTADDVSMTYGDALPQLTYTITGFVNGEVLGTSGVTGTPSIVCSAGPTTNAGTALVTVTIGTLAADNYTFEFVPGTLTIDKKFVAMTGDTHSFHYTARPAVLYNWVSYTQMFTVNGVYVGTFNPGAAMPVGINAGTYTCTGTIVDTNYYGSITDIVTIQRTSVTITFENLSKVYDGTPIEPVVRFALADGFSILVPHTITYIGDVVTNPSADHTNYIEGGCLFTVSVGDSNILEAAVSGYLHIFKATPTLTAVADIIGVHPVSGPGTIGAVTASDGSTVTLGTSNNGVCVVNGNLYTLTGHAGYALISAITSGSQNYVAITGIRVFVVDIAKGNQAITNYGIASTVDINGSVTGYATGGGSTAPVLFSTSSTYVATANGLTVTSVSRGTVIITANQAGDNDYNAAPPVQVGFLTVKAWITLASYNCGQIPNLRYYVKYYNYWSALGQYTRVVDPAGTTAITWGYTEVEEAGSHSSLILPDLLGVSLAYLDTWAWNGAGGLKYANIHIIAVEQYK